MDSEINSYFNKSATDYFEKSSSGIWGHTKKNEFKAVKSLLHINQDSIVLDIGAGPGYYSSKLQSEFGAQVIAYEYADEMIAKLKQFKINAVKHNLNEEINFPNYDYALILGVIEFLTQSNTLIKNLASSAGQKSKVILLLPKQGLVGLLYKTIHYYWGCPTTNFNESNIINIFEKYGFNLEVKKSSSMVSNVYLFSYQNLNQK